MKPGGDQLVTDVRSLRLESLTNHRVTPSWKASDWQKHRVFPHNGLTPDRPWDASARYEPAGPTACPRSGGSAGGRRKHRPPRSRCNSDSPDRLPGWPPKASDRWLPFGLPRRRPRPVECADIGPSTSRPSGPSAPQNFQDVPFLGRPQGLGYRGERGGFRTVPMETPYSRCNPRRRTPSG